MSEPEIQPFVAFISRRSQVIDAFILSHRVPFSIPGVVSPNVVSLGHKIKPDIPNTESDQSTITTFVAWCIIGAVYI
jgi:hypothetical protein